MITRYAFFEGEVKAGLEAEFQEAVKLRLVPLWRQFPGNCEVRVMFEADRDEGAPAYPLILAISYPDIAHMEKALNSSFRAQSRDVTAEIVETYFNGKIHHHVTIVGENIVSDR